MTKVEIFNHDGRINGFSVSGHSGYAEEGSDDTLFAMKDGVVRFERMGRDKKCVSVYEEIAQ